MALDADSQKYLEDAKKGQKRSFAMVCKGDKIVSLIVFKSGSVDKYKKQAKEKGTGSFSHGEIVGGGNNMIFRVAKSDGFTDVPAKDQKLKEFLKEEAELIVSPSFLLVESHALADAAANAPNPPKDNDAGSKPDAKPEQTPEQKPDAKVESKSDDKSGSKSDEAIQKKMRETLTKLGPLVKTVVQIVPDRKTEILKTYAALQQEIEGNDLDETRKKLKDYAALVQSLVASKGDGGDKQGKDGERDWGAAKKKWATNKATQLESVKETMNALGNLVLDTELDSDKVQALIEELSTYVPTFEKLAKALDDALTEVGNPVTNGNRDKVNAAIDGLRGFYNGARIQKLLADFDGKDFFEPTEEALNELSKLAS